MIRARVAFCLSGFLSVMGARVAHAQCPGWVCNGSSVIETLDRVGIGTQSPTNDAEIHNTGGLARLRIDSGTTGNGISGNSGVVLTIGEVPYYSIATWGNGTTPARANFLSRQPVIRQIICEGADGVYHRAEAGLLPCIRVGGLLRFDPVAIRESVRRT
jgi:hypothetical protein